MAERLDFEDEIRSNRRWTWVLLAASFALLALIAAAITFALSAGWVGLAIGLVNGVLVTMLRVPAFIATLTMLFIGRGLVLGLTGGKTISYAEKARENAAFFAWGEGNAFGFNNQILIFLALTAIGAVVRIYRGEQVLTRQVHAACGYLAHSSRTLHFGLGDEPGYDRIEIAWPSGRKETLSQLAVNQRHDLVEGEQK